MFTRRQLSFTGALALMSVAGCSLAQAPSMAGWPMPANAKPSVTYLHLLRKTPFFAGLGDEQLQWVIDHSREWSVPAGAEISSQALGPDNFWVLLDGGWQIERGTTVLKSGNNDAAKWYGGAELHAIGQGTRLVATAASYAMNIRWADVEDLRRRAKPVDAQLQTGLRAYRAAFPGR